MKKLILFSLLAVISLFANAQEVDVTSLEWVKKGQDCANVFNNADASLVFGTDAGGSNISYVDISAYGKINLYGTAGQTARLFINREEIGDKGIVFVDINSNGVGVFDCKKMLELQPTIQYIHLNGIKASAWNTKLNLSSITVSGDPITFPEISWVCPAGETDITEFAWIKKEQDCANNLSTTTDAVVFGTDAGGENISFVDITYCSSLKVYGPKGQKARFFINREEYSENFQFFAEIGNDGVGVLNLADVLSAQEGAKYIHLNGVKAASPGEQLKIDGITVIEKPWVCPEGEVDYTTLEGYKDVNNIGKSIKGGDVVYGNQSSGDDYVDVTAYDIVKFYGTPGALLRVFANRAGGEGVTVGKNEQRVSIGNDGVGTLDIKDVMEATEKEYCYLSGIKICAAWQGASIDQKIVIKGISVVSAPAPYTIATTAGKIGTVVLDYPASIEGATLYEVASFDASTGLELAEVEGDMVGGTPYIYVASADKVVCTKKGSSVAHGDFDCTKGNVGNGLVGCYSEVSPTKSEWFGFIRSSYIINNNQLRQIGQGNITIPANRCFFDPSKYDSESSASGAKTITIPTEEATAIKNVNASLEGGKIYDMNGREVKSMKKGGIYVVGGMKISVK